MGKQLAPKKVSSAVVHGLDERSTQARKRLGLTYRGASKRVGLAAMKLHAIEHPGFNSGVNGPTLVKLAVGYGVSTDWLCSLTNDARPASELAQRIADLELQLASMKLEVEESRNQAPGKRSKGRSTRSRA